LSAQRALSLRFERAFQLMTGGAQHALDLQLGDYEQAVPANENAHALVEPREHHDPFRRG
jgi:hypothetical protein